MCHIALNHMVKITICDAHFTFNEMIEENRDTCRTVHDSQLSQISTNMQFITNIKIN